MGSVKKHTSSNHYIMELENGQEAYVEFYIKDDTMFLIHSFVPPGSRGNGIGKALVESTFEQLTNEGYKAKAVCSYIRVIASRSPKWKDIIEY